MSVRGLRIRAIRAAAVLAAGVASVAPTWAEALLIPPDVFHGQWSLEAPATDCSNASTAIFARSNGFASTLSGYNNRLEAVGTWTLEDEVLVLSISELIAPGASMRMRYNVVDYNDDVITLSDVATGEQRLLLHRCPD